ncbi:MAG: hypothetical protein V1872_07585 [bacterium]
MTLKKLKDQEKIICYLPLLIFIFSFLYLLTFCRYGINLWDEGVLLNGALRVLAGEVPIKDFIAYPPGRYYLLAIFFRLFGTHLIVARIFISLMTAFMSVLAFLITKEITDIKFGLLVSGVVLFVPAAYYVRFFPLFTLIDIYVICLLIKRQKLQVHYFPLLALLAIFTGLFKLEISLICFLVTILFLSLITVNSLKFNNKNNWIIPLISKYIMYILSVFIILLPFLFYLRAPSIKTTFTLDFFHLVFKNFKDWANPFPNPLLFIKVLFKDSSLNPFKVMRSYPPLTLHNIKIIILLYLPLLNNTLEGVIFYLPIAIYLLTLIYLVSLWKKERFNLKEDMIFVILSFGIFTYGLVICRAGFHNLLRCIMPAYILGAFWLSKGYNYTIKPGSNYTRITICIFLILIFPLIYIAKITYYNKFYGGSIGAIIDNTSFIKYEDLDHEVSKTRYIKVDKDYARWISEIVSHIVHNTNSEDYLFAIPFNPIWNYLTNRPNPSYYEWLLPGIRNPEEVFAKVIYELEKKNTKYIVYIDIPIDSKEERRFANYARPIENYIRVNYYIEKIVGPFQILRRYEDALATAIK